MKLWAEVYTPDGSHMLGVVKLVSATIERRLDGVGQIEISVPAGDLQAAKLLQIRRRVHLYTDTQPGKRLIIRAILMRPAWRPAQDSTTTTWECDDDLGGLKDINTFRGLYYEEISAAYIARDLIKRVEGWHVKIEPGLDSIITTQRFDAVSIFKAFTKLIETTGLHLRLGPEGLSRWLTLGTFGDDARLRLSNIKAVHPMAGSGQDTAYVDRIEIVQDGYQIANLIEPLGGSGDYPLTLKRATKSSPYPIEQMTGPDGRTIYYLKDDASIAKYGVVQRVLPLPGAVPVSADTVSLRAPANVVYDWGVSQLERLKDPQWVYRASGVKVDKTIYPGQQIRLVYAGFAYHGQLPAKYLDVDELVYVTKINETYDNEGKSVTFEISNKNALYQTVAEVIAKALRTQSDIILSTRLVQNPGVYSLVTTISNQIIYTSNLCVEGTPEASDTDGSYPVENAFDGSAATDWKSTETPGTHNIAYRMTSQQSVKRYSIRASATDNSQAPIWFELRYWDGDAYQVADSRTGQAAWSAGEERTFDVAGDFTSSKWQLQIYTYGARHYVAIAEINMYAISSAPVAMPISIPSYVLDLGRFELFVTRADINGPQGFTVRLGTENILDGPWVVEGGPFLETPDDGDTFHVSLEDISPQIAGNHTVYIECTSGIGEIDVKVKTIEATIAIS